MACIANSLSKDDRLHLEPIDYTGIVGMGTPEYDRAWLSGVHGQDVLGLRIGRIGI